MNSIDEKIRLLTESIKSTREFQKLKHSRDIIATNRDLKNRIMSFNKQQADILASRLPARDAQAKMGELERQLQSLSTIPEVAEYLKNFKKFNDIMVKVNHSINSSLDRDLGFR